jgi:hypothetical protein
MRSTSDFEPGDRLIKNGLAGMGMNQLNLLEMLSQCRVWLNAMMKNDRLPFKIAIVYSSS